jgi:hypothetical protein
MKISRLLSRTAALAALSVLGAGAANAQQISAIFNNVSGAAGNFVYSYTLNLGANTRTTAGDLFTFYDFDGFLTGGANSPTFTPDAGNPGNYTITSQLLGLDPPGTAKLAGDDPGIQNVSLNYTGAPFVNATSGQKALGVVLIHSTNPINIAGDFTAYAASATNNQNSAPAGNQSFVTGPNLKITGQINTPEPGTWAMLAGMGVSGLAVVRRRRRK